MAISTLNHLAINIFFIHSEPKRCNVFAQYFFCYLSPFPNFSLMLYHRLHIHRIWSRKNMIWKIAVMNHILHEWYKMAWIWIHFNCVGILMKGGYQWFPAALKTSHCCLFILRVGSCLSSYIGTATSCTTGSHSWKMLKPLFF